jgi:hypothetical protein
MPKGQISVAEMATEFAVIPCNTWINDRLLTASLWQDTRAFR